MHGKQLFHKTAIFLWICAMANIQTRDFYEKSYCEDPPIIPTLNITANGAPADLYENVQMRSYEDIRISHQFAKT